jgi:hypothetical protein
LRRQCPLRRVRSAGSCAMHPQADGVIIVTVPRLGAAS